MSGFLNVLIGTSTSKGLMLTPAPSATTVLTTSITFSWTAITSPVTATSYYYYTTITGYGTASVPLSTASTSVVLTVTAGQSVTFYVSAAAQFYTNSSYGSASATSYAGTMAAPSAPTGVATSTTSVNFTWTAVTSPVTATSYDYYTSLSGSAASPIGSTASTSQSITTTAGQAVTLYIRALAATYISSPYSPGGSGTSWLGVMGNPSISGSPTSTIVVTFSWGAVTSPVTATSYEYYSTTTGYGTVSVPLSTTNTSVAVTVGAANTSSTFNVRAVNTGNYGKSSYMQASATSYIGTLGTPTASAGTRVSTTTVNFTWSAVTNATSYSYYTSFQGSAGAPIGTVTAPTVTVTVTSGASAGATVTFYVKATATNYIDSAYSTGVSGTAYTGQLADVTVNAGTPATLNTVTFTWGAVTNATSYDYYTALSGTALAPNNTASVSVTVSTSGTGQTISLNVKAITTGNYIPSVNWGSNSGTSYAGTMGTPAPAGSAANLSVYFTWPAITSPATATSYEYYSNIAGNGTSGVPLSTTNTFVYITVAANTPAQLTVRAVRSGYITSAYSTTASGTSWIAVLGTPAVNAGTPVTTTSVSFTWGAITNANNYWYYTSTAPTPVNNGTTTSATVATTGAGNSVTCYVYATSTGNYGQSSTGSNTGASYSGTMSAPVVNAGTRVTTTTVNFTWGAVTSPATATAYYYYTSANATVFSNGTSTSITVSNNGTPGAAVTLFVKALATNYIDSVYNSAAGTPYTGTLSNPAPAVSGTPTVTNITFAWTAITNATGYEYYTSLNATVTSNGNNVSTTLTQADNTAVTFYVRAITTGNYITSGYGSASGSTAIDNTPTSIVNFTAPVRQATVLYAINTVVTSDTQVLSGFSKNASIAVSISGNSGTINGGSTGITGSWLASQNLTTDGSGNLYVAVRLTTGAAAGTAYTSTVTVGSSSVSYSILTAEAAPAAPAMSATTATSSTITWGTLGVYQILVWIGGVFYQTYTTGTSAVITLPSNTTSAVTYQKFNSSTTNWTYQSPATNVLTLPGAPTTITGTPAVSTLTISVNASGTTAVTWTVYINTSASTSGATTITTTLAGTPSAATTYGSYIGNTSYYVGALATNATGAGTVGWSTQFTTFPDPPTLAQDLVATGAGQLGATLTAPAGGTALTRTYQLRESNGTLIGSSATSPYSVTFYSYAGGVLNLVGNTSYNVYATTSTTAGLSANGTTKTFWTKVPIIAAPTYTSLTATSFTINWVAPGGTGTVTYDVYNNLGQGQITGTSSLSLGIISATANTSYTYYVYGNNAIGVGVGGTLSSVITLPNAPGTPTYGTKTSFSIIVNWTAPTGGTALTVTYRPVRVKISDSSTTTLSDVAVLTVTDNGLTENSNYAFKIAAVTTAGLGAYSTQGATVLTLPGQKAAPTFSGVTSTQMTVNWTTNPGDGTITAYKVYNGAGTLQNGVGTTSLSWTTGALATNTLYTYYIIATNASGTGVNGVTNSQTTAPGAPGTPTFGTKTLNSIVVNWTASPVGGNANAITYTPYRGATALSATSLLTVTDGSLASNTTYTYSIVASGAAGTATSSGTSAGVLTIPANPTVAPTFSSITTATASISCSSSTGDGTITWYIYLSPSTLVTPAGTSTVPIGVSLAAGNTSYSYYYTWGNSSGTSGNSPAGAVISAPAVPATPTFGTKTNSSIVVNWTASTGGTALTITYTVRRTLVSNSTTTDLTGTTSLTTTDSSLAGNTQYKYQVSATTTAGASAFSTISAAVLTIPDTMAAPTFSNISDQSYDINWVSPGGDGTISAYIVYNNSNVAQNGTGTTALLYGKTGLTGNTQYTFYVRATNASGQGAVGTSASQYTACSKPGTPTFGTITASSIVVNWTAPAGAAPSSYTVYPLTGAGAALTEISGITGTTTTVGSLASNSTYYCFVRGLGPANAGIISSQSATVTTTPGPPTGVAAGTPTTAQLVVTWTAPAGTGAITSYSVTATPTIATRLLASGAAYTGLSPNSGYTFTVTATNSGGTSGASTASTISYTLPATAPTPTATFSSYTMTITWTVTSGVKYNVQRVNPAATIAVNNTTGSVSEVCAVGGLLPGVATQYVITAIGVASGLSASANSTASTAVTITKLAYPTPVAPTVGSATTTGFTVTWTPPAGATGWSIQIWASNSAVAYGSAVAVASGTSSTVTVTPTSTIAPTGIAITTAIITISSTLTQAPLVVGEKIVITGTKAGTSTTAGLAAGTFTIATVPTATSFTLTGVTCTKAGTITGLTFTYQYSQFSASVTATADTMYNASGGSSRSVVIGVSAI